MKKTYQLIIIAVILLLIILLPSIVKADTLTWKDESQGIEWQYELDENNNVINLNCADKVSVAGKVVIPSEIDGKKVVSLLGTKYPWTSNDAIFKNCAGLIEVSIPNSISQIPDSAFYNCVGLKSVTIPDNINLIGEYAFYGCTGIADITFSKEIKSIKKSAFESCAGIKTLNLPEKLVSIGESAFKGCSGLKKLDIPNSVTTIEQEAFSECYGLTEITLSNQLTRINIGTFYKCSRLTSIIIPDSVTTISSTSWDWEKAFGGCTNLEKILIPDSVATISTGSFDGCSKLTIYGNDGMKSKEFAEENNIKFDYIANWDKKDTGDDVTAPAVEKIEISEDSIKNCTKDTNTKSYIAPANTKIIINVKFSENLVGNTMPSLVIKFGDSKEIELTNGVLGGSTISYSYTIKDEDKGTISAVNLKGGDLKDAVGNVAVLSCPNINIQYSEYSLYANGSLSENVPDNKDDQKQDDTNKDNTNKDNTNKDNTSKNDTNNDNNQNNEKKDNTTATGNIPQTGMNYTVISIIALIAIISIVSYKKYTNYKDVK